MLELVWMTLITKADPLFLSIKKLNSQLDKFGHHGLTFKSVLHGIGLAAEFAFTSLSKMVDVATKLAALGNEHPKTPGAVGHVGTSSAMGAINPVLGMMRLLGHAEGGVVTGVHGGIATVQPAPGEGLASIGRGERIVSARGGEGKGGFTVHVMPGAVVIHSSQGERIIDLTEEALSLVFERIALKQGLA